MWSWREYGDQGLTVLAIDMQEPPILAAGWAAANAITYPILSAPDWSLLFQFGSGSIPYNAILDTDGVLRYASYGFDLNTIRDLILDLLPDDTPVEDTSWGVIKELY